MNGTVAAARWPRQHGVVTAIELRRTLWTRRALPLLLLACIAPATTALAGLFAPSHARAFDSVFFTLVVGVGVFFGSAVTQTKLLRGEIVAQTLHYYLLTPIGREALVVGKYLAGLLGTGGVFAAATVVCYVMPAVWGAELGAGVGPSGLANRLATVVLGCAAYGAVFLLFGALFRNPVLPVAGLLGWELLHFLLPPTLQAFSIARHLRGVLGEDATAPPAWVSAPTLLALAAAAVALACGRLRRLEID